MHAPDWQAKYKIDLRRSLPRIPLANDFEAFRQSGRQLIDLHINYETCPEWPLKLESNVQQQKLGEETIRPDYSIKQRMRWGRDPNNPRKKDYSVLHINENHRLVDIPAQAHQYKISGRSPLQWAVDGLQLKDNDDPNNWFVWKQDRSLLIKHLKRLCYLSITTTEIINKLPPSLQDQEQISQDEH